MRVNGKSSAHLGEKGHQVSQGVLVTTLMTLVVNEFYSEKANGCMREDVK